MKSLPNLHQELERIRPENAKELLVQIAEQGSAQTVPILVELLRKNQDAQINTQVLSVLSSLRQVGAMEMLVTCIKNEQDVVFRSILLTAIWANTFSLSHHLPYWIALAVSAQDSQTILECFSILESLPIHTDARLLADGMAQLNDYATSLAEKHPWRSMYFAMADALQEIRQAQGGNPDWEAGKAEDLKDFIDFQNNEA
jgi:hypothetical protein